MTAADQTKKTKMKQRTGGLGRCCWNIAFWTVAVACVLALLSSRIPLVRIANDGETTTPGELYAARYRRFFSTEEDVRALEEARGRFEKEHGNEYGYGNRTAFENLIATEMSRFDGEVYCDYTGSGVYQESQLRGVYGELAATAYGNAHSRNPSSLAAEGAIERAREMVLRHFNVTASEYSVIFTSGATAALKLVGESFPWTNSSRFVYLRQNHNSVLGIRELALGQGASFHAIPEADLLDVGSCNKWIGDLSSCESGKASPPPPPSPKKGLLTQFPDGTYNLFAFPAQDNFAGVKYPLEWIDVFHKAGGGKWLVLLDAAAFVPTHSLDLHTHPADFVTISFYKIFGYPTGLGALLVRNDVVDVMQKTFFGGGTVILSSCDTHFCLLHQNPCSRFEDGTVSFLSIAALRHGFDALRAASGLSGKPTSTSAQVMEPITRHVQALTRHLYQELAALKHSNGKPVVWIHGKHSADARESKAKQGSIVNFNVLAPDGSNVGYHAVQSVTARDHVHLRTGCNCNPGACYDYLGVTSEEVVRYSLEKKSCGDELDVTADGKPLGAVRVSLGYLSTFEDVQAVVGVIRKNFAQ